MQTTQEETINQENYIVEVFKKILPYKWSIMIIAFITTLLATFYLYFIPSVYESYAIVKVKSNQNKTKTNDLFQDTFDNISSAGIKQETLSLKTFKINKETLKEIDFSVLYFQKIDYKTVELYDKSPISLEVEHRKNVKLVDSKIEVNLRDNGFTLKTKEKGESEVYPFDEKIETDYFIGTVTQKEPFSTIYIILNGNSRQIFESMIKSNLKVSQLDKGANLIRVAFEDTIPERATQYVNTLVENYIKQNIATKESANKKILGFLDLQLETIKKKLEKSENELEKYKTANSIEPSVKSKDSFDKLSAIDLELSEIELKEKLAKNLITFVKNNRNLDPISPTLLEFNDKTSIKLIDKLEEMQQEEDTLTLEYTDQYPKLKNLRKSMKRIKRKILFNVKNLKSVLTAKRSSLEEQRHKYEKVLKTLPKKEKNLIHFKRDYEVNSKMYTYLLEKKSEKELIKVASIADYEIVDPAYTSYTPIRPKRLLFLIASAIIGFILAVVIAFVRASFRKKSVTHQEIAQVTKLPIYGIIPLYTSNSSFSPTILKEAYHKLATNLQFSKNEHSGNIVLITSPTEGEGKTTTLVNLAGVFQNTEYRTVAIDLNLRSPSLHEHFGITQQYSGMSTYLSQQDNIGNIIFSTNYENLDIIPAGPTPPNPYELILSNRLTELFDLLRQKYDYILIDTASYSFALETLYLMKFTNTNLVVLREKFSEGSTIEELEKIVREKNLKNIGLVLKSIVKENKNKKNLLEKLSSASESQQKSPLQLGL